MLKTPFTLAAPLAATPSFFVGRDEEIPQLARAFAVGQSIVIWGVGGIGKTALAHHLIERQAWRFGDPPAIARHSCENGLGVDSLLDSLPAQLPFVPTGQGLPPDERRAAVLASFSGRRALLVVDNFETAADQEPFLAFLSQLPRGCLALLTTREAVRCPGWLLLELKPLAADAALRLLLQHLPGRQIPPGQAAGAQALLQQVAGHPLAIELAAALTRDWPDLGELAAALATQRARLADSTLHGVPERLRSLEVSLSLSFERLTPAEQHTLTCLAVWRTPFDDAGAQKVAALAPAGWAAACQTLRTRSLLYQDAERYWFHPLVRDFGLARLAAPAATQRRAAQFLQERWQDGYPVTPQEALALPLHWLAADDWPAAASAGSQLVAQEASLDSIGFWSEIAAVLKTLLHEPPDDQGERVVDLWVRLSSLERALGDYTNALSSAQRGLVLARQVGDRLGEANVLQAIGDVQQFRADREAALQSYGQALALFRQVGDRLGEANVLKAIGDVQQFRADREAALQSYGQALALFRQVGDRLGEANVLKAIGDVQQFRDDREAALQSYGQALALFRQVGDRLGEANVLKAIGDVQQFRDDREAALQSYGQALALFRQVGARLGEANVLKAIGDVQQFRADREAALQSYGQALALFRQVGARLGEANVLKAIGDVQQFRADREAALQSYGQALALFRQVGDRLGEANVLKAIGDVQQFRADREAALQSYGQALALFRQVGDRLGEANVLKAIGDVQQFRADREAALQSYGQALALFRQVGARLGEANVLLSMGDLLRRRQDYTQAWQCYVQAQQNYTMIGDIYSQARVLYRMGDALVEQERRSEAIALYEEAIARWRSIGMTDLVNNILIPRLQRARQ